MKLTRLLPLAVLLGAFLTASGGREARAADTTCGAAATRAVHVADEAGLRTALAGARPGDAIELAARVFHGTFVTSRSGLSTRPIVLCGLPGTVIDGGTTMTGYGLHLWHANWWTVRGVTVQHALFGVMLDDSSHDVLDGLDVHDVGYAGIRLRAFSRSNVVRESVVHNTGQRRASFGEGIYVGTSVRSWCAETACVPDASNDNTITANRIYATTAESVDVKEGTVGGRIQGNHFDGARMIERSWVDVKGNGWTIADNDGVSSPRDGFMTEQILPGWGIDNEFTHNRANVEGPGFGIRVSGANAVRCDNAIEHAGSGYANVPCSNTHLTAATPGS